MILYPTYVINLQWTSSIVPLLYWLCSTTKYASPTPNPGATDTPSKRKGGENKQNVYTCSNYLQSCRLPALTRTVCSTTSPAQLSPTQNGQCLKMDFGAKFPHIPLFQKNNSQTENSQGQPLFSSSPSCKWWNFRGHLENFSWLQSSLYEKLTTTVEETLSSASSGHLYSPVTTFCFKSGWPQEKHRYSFPSPETFTLIRLILSKRRATAQVSVLFAIKTQVLQRTYFLIKGGRWEHWPNSYPWQQKGLLQPQGIVCRN